MSGDVDPTQFISPEEMEGGMRGLAAGRRVFGRYRLEKIAGRGGMGIVWRARDEELERVVALKFLPADVAADVEAVRDLKIETKRCLDLTHPQIVRVYDFVQGPAGAAIAMEFVEGESLASRKAASPNGCLSVTEVARFIGQLCAALDYAHFKVQLLHRDLKPANLLITPAGDLKVMDFGIACSLVETRTRLTADANRSTSGTPLYMSPQQLMGEKPSVADDVYALGATLYELLTSKPPFYRGDGYALVMQVREKAPKSMAEQRAELQIAAEPIPTEWEQVIRACLAKDPKDRPRSAGEVAERLGVGGPRPASAMELRTALPAEKSGGVEAAVPSANRNSRRLVVGASAAVFVVGLVLAYFAFSRPASDGAASATIASRVLAPESVAPVPASAPAAAFGGAIIRTEPPGAEVTVGSAGRGMSPFTLRDARPGRYPVRVRASGYEEWSGEVLVKENDFAELEAVLERSTGTLVVTSEPAGLEAELIGRATPNGPAPAESQAIRTPQKVKLPTGGYDIVFRRAGWPEQRHSAEIVRNQIVETAAAFVPGKAVITSEPGGARVVANGTELGATPLTLPDWPPGALKVELRLKGYQPATLSGNVVARQELRLDAVLERPSAPVAGRPAHVPELDLELKFIPAGAFVMGSPETEAERESDEGPQTRVTFTQGFWLGRTEVTQAQYEAIMGANPSEFLAAGRDAPVENVSWLDAMDFCRRLTEREQAEGRLPAGYIYTLPTEAQWEYACRAGTTTPFSGEPQKIAWLDKAGGKTTRPVGQKAPNAWGLHDMHGNVWEWCLDPYVDRWPGESVTDYHAGAYRPGAAHAYRGGGWNNSVEDARAARRVEASDDDREVNVGFRLALSQPAPAAVTAPEVKRSGFGAGVKSTLGGLLKVIKPGDTRGSSGAPSGILHVTINQAPPAPLRFTITLARADGPAEFLEFPVDETAAKGRTGQGAFTTKLTLPPGAYTFVVKSPGFKDVTQTGRRLGAEQKKDRIEIKAGDESTVELELERADGP